MSSCALSWTHKCSNSSTSYCSTCRYYFCNQHTNHKHEKKCKFCHRIATLAGDRCSYHGYAGVVYNGYGGVKYDGRG